MPLFGKKNNKGVNRHKLRGMYGGIRCSRSTSRQGGTSPKCIEALPYRFQMMMRFAKKIVILNVNYGNIFCNHRSTFTLHRNSSLIRHLFE